ncbi:hypothetical protein AN216_00195, partial [Streptomyces oceani]
MRRAGVSSFGLSGTNAHVLVAEPEPAPAAPAPAGDTGTGTETGTVSGGLVPWLLSARGPEALQAQAARLERYVRSRPELTPAAAGRALARRSRFEHRAVVVGGSRD